MRARRGTQSGEASGHSKRGILENDILLGNFAAQHLPTLTNQELQLYDDLLGENDWDIYYWVRTGSAGQVRRPWAANRRWWLPLTASDPSPSSRLSVFSLARARTRARTRWLALPQVTDAKPTPAKYQGRVLDLVRDIARNREHRVQRQPEEPVFQSPPAST